MDEVEVQVKPRVDVQDGPDGRAAKAPRPGRIRPI